MATIPHESGIYEIRCRRTKKVYIGSAADLYKRRQGHWSTLRAGTHVNEYLQRAWDKYGAKAFTFSVLQTAPIDQLLVFEQLWIDCKQAFKSEYGYNLAPIAGSNRGYKHAASFGENISQRREQVWEGFVSPDGVLLTITNLWQFCKEMHLSFSAMHRLATGEGRTKSYKGWTHQNNVKAVTESKTYEGFIDPQGNEHDPITGLQDFCRQNDLNSGHMSDVYRGKRATHKGWTHKNGYVAPPRSPSKKVLKVYYGFIDPSGRMAEPIVDLTDFCSKNELDLSSMLHLISGRQHSHRGWTYYGHSRLTPIRRRQLRST